MSFIHLLLPLHLNLAIRFRPWDRIVWSVHALESGVHLNDANVQSNLIQGGIFNSKSIGSDVASDLLELIEEIRYGQCAFRNQ